MKTPTNYNPDVLSCLANLSNDEVFTPPNLVNQILDMLPVDLWQNKDAKFLDPVSKSGVFLREITLRLMNGLEKQIPDHQERVNHILENQIYGIAITELTALLSRRSIYCSKTANGKYSICSTFKNKQGNILFDRTEHLWQNEKCKYCNANKSEYDRGELLETHAYQFIHTNEPNNLFNNMKFDVIIGNPPYQLSDGGNAASASPIYNKFVEQAKKLNPRFLTMIVPSRWFAGGKGLDGFREEMLNDKRLRIMYDFVNAKDCFPGISLGGGVCYFLWNRDNIGECKFTNNLNGKENTLVRKLDQFPVFVRYNQAISIIEKVSSKNESSLSVLIDSRNPYGISSSKRGKKNIYKDAVTLYSSDGVSYIDLSQVKQGEKSLHKHKVMISKVTSEHAGEPDKNGQFKIISKIQILKPNEVCTDSYLIAGLFTKSYQSVNLMNYIKCKFTRFLLLQAVSSINLSKDKFYFVPNQDFNEQWTDEKLYKKYGITREEQAFIDSLIKQME